MITLLHQPLLPELKAWLDENIPEDHRCQAARILDECPVASRDLIKRALLFGVSTCDAWYRSNLDGLEEALKAKNTVTIQVNTKQPSWLVFLVLSLFSFLLGFVANYILRYYF